MHRRQRQPKHGHLVDSNRTSNVGHYVRFLTGWSRNGCFMECPHPQAKPRCRGEGSYRLITRGRYCSIGLYWRRIRTSCGNHPMSQQGQWQVAGSAPDVYERELVPAVFGPWAPVRIELAGLKPGHRVIDVACGSGIVARVAAARVGPSGAVSGVDLNSGMLNVARSLKTSDDR
jgi:SAM-dependent methyltransferase